MSFITLRFKLIKVIGGFVDFIFNLSIFSQILHQLRFLFILNMDELL